MRALVRKAIAEALTDSSPQGHPFLVLREAGVVAQIRSAIRQRLADLGQGRCQGRLVARAKKPRYLWGPEEAHTDEVLLDRVQMELKLSADLAAWNPGDRLDLLVLADTVVELACWNNGPGDVVASVPSSCVQAAIEVKAAPSVDPEQVLRFRQDLDKLLRFLSLPAPSKGACAFFVLLDKSSHWFGRWDESVPCLDDRRVQWRTVGGLDDLLKGHPRNSTVDAARSRLKALGIRLQDGYVPHAPFVELVVLGESQPLYAVRSH